MGPLGEDGHRIVGVDPAALTLQELNEGQGRRIAGVVAVRLEGQTPHRHRAPVQVAQKAA